jgi:hypothetical protein
VARPHHAFPLRLNNAGTGFVTVEEDSVHEREGRVAMTIRCPLGFVDSREDFGRRQLAQSLEDPMEVLDQVIREQQPDCHVLLSERPDAAKRLTGVIVSIRTDPTSV